MEEQAVRGYFFGLLTALCWAVSPMFIKLGLEGLSSSEWGTAIGLISATGIYFLWIFTHQKPDFDFKENKTAIKWQLIGGVTGSLGIILRNVALDLASVGTVMALSSIAPLFTLFFGPLLFGSRYQERISVQLVIGIFAIVVGSIFIIFGRQ